MMGCVGCNFFREINPSLHISLVRLVGHHDLGNHTFGPARGWPMQQSDYLKQSALRAPLKRVLRFWFARICQEGVSFLKRSGLAQLLGHCFSFGSEPIEFESFIGLNVYLPREPNLKASLVG